MQAATGNMESPLSREIVLLAECLAASADTGAIVPLAAQIDWPAFLELSRKHGVSPLVFHSLESCALPPAATETLAALQEDFQLNALNSARLSMELLGSIRLLAQHGITAVPFKGAALAASTYGQVWLRQFSDIDLLVSARQAVAAKTALAERGYRGSLELSAVQQPLLVEESPFAYAFSLIRDGGPLAIDLHWRLAEAGHPAYPVRLNEPWDRLIEIDYQGSPVLAFSPEDTLLLVSAHAAKHAWGRLRWICDIAQAVRAAPDLEWDDLMHAASEAGPIGRRTLLTSLGVADALFDLPLPDDIRSQIAADEVSVSTVKEVLQGLGTPEQDWPQWWPRSFESDAYFLRLAGGGWTSVHYFLVYCAWRVAAPDAKDRAWIDLPGPLSFLYYLLRPIRLIREYGWGPLWEFVRLPLKIIRSS